MRRVVLFSALLVFAGCGSAASSPPPSLPDGFARYDQSGVTFGHPSGWTRDEPVPGQIEFYGAPGVAGLPPQVAIGAAPARNDLGEVVSLHKNMQKIRWHDYQVVAEKPLSLPGAAGAHRIDATYVVSKDDERVVLREVNLLVVTEDGRQLNFFVRSPDADYAASGLETVFESFRLK